MLTALANPSWRCFLEASCMRLVPQGSVRNFQRHKHKNTSQTWVSGTVSVTLVRESKGQGQVSVQFKTGWLVPPVLMTLKWIIDRLLLTLC